MIYGIGIDIVAVERFEKFLAQGKREILERLFTFREIESCSGRKAAAECLAARFAAKEAFLKALGCGLRDGLSWRDMEVVKDFLGKPGMELSGKALEMFRLNRLSSVFLSLSHDNGNAVAMIVLEGP